MTSRHNNLPGPKNRRAQLEELKERIGKKQRKQRRVCRSAPRLKETIVAYYWLSFQIEQKKKMLSRENTPSSTLTTPLSLPPQTPSSSSPKRKSSDLEDGEIEEVVAKKLKVRHLMRILNGPI